MKYNRKAVSKEVTVNLAGGSAYKESPKLQIATHLLTSFVQDQYYRSAQDGIDTLLPLVAQEPLFAAKAAVFARREYGMRSVSHVVAAEICHLPSIKGQAWKQKFLHRLFKRTDDMLEIMACYTAKYGAHPIPNALKRAVRKTLGELDAYQLAKYKGEGKQYKLVDLVNLTHPRRRPELKALVDGTLKPAKTWEVGLTQAGQKAEEKDLTESEKKELKAEVWEKLLKEGKLGYFALLRNLRNIIEQCSVSTLELACTQLVDENRIRKSLVLPFRFKTAVEEIEKLSASKKKNMVLDKLHTALELSLSNVPTFSGTTLVAVDVSGSMQGKPLEIGSLFAAAIYKRNGLNCDLMVFNDRAATPKGTFHRDSMLTIARNIEGLCSGGTDFSALLSILPTDRKYDRIIVLSDMQSWMQDRHMTSYLDVYRKKAKADPFIFSFDLQHYGQLLLPERRCYCISGFSEKVFDMMKVLEQDQNVLVKTIEGVEF